MNEFSATYFFIGTHGFISDYDYLNEWKRASIILFFLILLIGIWNIMLKNAKERVNEINN